MKLFTLSRSHDISRVTGTGHVAEGVLFSDGTVVLHWVVGEFRSTSVYPDIKAINEIHGHDGLTEIVWKD